MNLFCRLGDRSFFMGDRSFFSRCDRTPKAIAILVQVHIESIIAT
ncbi:MAG TPA: hypothetical protein V6C58_11840 [Allocoleopsis sp.]